MLKLINKHENDSHIIFYEEPHIYSVDGENYNLSVTKFVHKYFPEFNPDNVIDKMMLSSKWNQSEYFGMTKQDIKNAWKKSGTEASKLGTKLHKSIENYYNNVNQETNDSVEYQYFINFHNKVVKNKLIPYRCEWEVFDRKLKLAGSIDMIYKDSKEDVFDIYDWKRCKQIKDNNSFESALPPIDHLPNSNKWHYSLQLNTYKYILENNYNLKIRNMVLVCLHPNNNSYMLVKVPDLSNEINSIIENENIKKRKFT